MGGRGEWGGQGREGMYWKSFEEFLDMGGYAFFVWSSVGVVAAAMLLEVLTLRSRRAQSQMRRAPHTCSSAPAASKRCSTSHAAPPPTSLPP